MEGFVLIICGILFVFSIVNIFKRKSEFESKKCSCCGGSLPVDGTTELLDGYICPSCFKKAGFSTFSGRDLQNSRKFSASDMKRMMQGLKPLSAEDIQLAGYREQNISRIQKFLPTKIINKYIQFSDYSREFVVGELDLLDIFSYDNISSYVLLENGNAVAEANIGGAVMGGLMFGDVGAVIGASNQRIVKTCDSLCIKITLRNTYRTNVYVNFLAMPVKTNTAEYSSAYRQAQDCLSMLELAQNNTSIGADSIANEIRAYKKLADEGLLTEQEYETKKKQLLNL